MTELDGQLNRSLLFELLDSSAVRQHRQQQDGISGPRRPLSGGVQLREGFEQRARQYGEASGAILSALRLHQGTACGSSPSEPLPHLRHASKGQAGTVAVLDPVAISMDKVWQALGRQILSVPGRRIELPSLEIAAYLLFWDHPSCLILFVSDLASGRLYCRFDFGLPETPPPPCLAACLPSEIMRGLCILSPCCHPTTAGGAHAWPVHPLQGAHHRDADGSRVRCRLPE